MKKPIAILMAAIIILSIATSALLLPACAATDTDDQAQGSEGAPSEDDASSMKFTLKAGEYEITKDENNLDVIQMEGFSLAVSPGDPMLPHKVYNIIVPPDVIWSSMQLKIVSAETRILDGTYNIKPAAPDVAWVDGRWIEDWGKGKNIVNGRNINVYETDSSFPENSVELLLYSQMRKWKFARVDFYPFQYNLTSRELTLTESVVIEISYSQPRAELDESLLADTVMDDIAPQIFLNYGEARGWYEQEVPMEEPQQVYDYVIITTNLIETNSANLSSFIALKQSLGHSVLVVTEDDFGGLTGQAPNNKAEKIRQWLINNYAAMGIEYVLLIGDPHPYESEEGDIPMKMCWPISTSHDETPTDFFYADLTGNWDKDGDLYYGEWSDDYSVSGGVDFTAEVWVGRIPVYGADYTTLDNILQKIIGYETEPAGSEAPGDISWRESILMPMGFQDATGPYDGAMLAEQMKDDYLDTAGFTSWRMYQQGNGACALDSTYTSEEELRGGTVVRDRWAGTDFGVVAWWAHGSATGASVGYNGCWDGTLMNSGYTSSLDDDHPAFTYQCSCTNGYPEDSNNLQYAILKQGGIATVSATRVSWFNTGVPYGDFDGSTTNSGIGYEYVKRLVQDLPGGKALYLTKGPGCMAPESTTRLMNWYDFNLYGDPDCYLLSTVPNLPPVADANGPYEVNEGSPVPFNASGSYDPEGDLLLEYRWDFENDGSWDTAWSTDATAEHTWCDDHTGTAKVEVRDQLGFTDDDIASVTVLNVAPTVNAGTDQTVNEGDTVALSSSFSDPGWCDSHTATIDWGDGSLVEPGTVSEENNPPDATGTVTGSHAYGDNGVYTVNLTVIDDDGGVGTDTLTVTVNNVAPVVASLSTATIDEDGTATFTGHATDPGSDDLTFAWAWQHRSICDKTTTYYNDGIGPDPYPSPDVNPMSATDSASCQYGDNGVYNVTLTVTDDDGGSTTVTTTVIVNNVDPTASIAMTQPNPQFILPIVHTLTFDGSSEDPGSDDLTFEWDFDDGTVVTTTYYNNDPINTTDPYPSPDVNPMDVTDTQTHIYASPGTYIVSLPVTDDDSGVGSGTHTVIVFTAEEAKHDINGYIQDLPDSYFKGNANQRKNAYNSMLMAIDDMLIDEEYQGAIRDLQNNIRPKSDTDCAVNDGNSKNDWIIDPKAQEHICMKIDDLTAYLEYLKTL